MIKVLIAAACLVASTVGAFAQDALRIGDTVEINVYQDPKLDRRVRVGRDGAIAVPLAGRVRAAGRAPGAVEADLRNKLQKNYSEPLDVTVSLVEPSKPDSLIPRPPVEDELKPRIYVTGEIAKPGSFPIARRITVMQALAQAGGLGPFAAHKRIQIRRQSGGRELVFGIDYDAFLEGTSVQGNIDLQPGDVIVVPERTLFE
jgi:polysaccharide export outer membrane protein